MAKRPTNEGLSALSRIPVEARRKIDAWHAQANAIERAQFATVQKRKEQSKPLTEMQQLLWNRVLQAGEVLLQNQPADAPPPSVEVAAPSFIITPATNESESGAVTAEQTFEGSEKYMIGEVEERKGKKGPIQVIVIQDGAKKRVVRDAQVDNLPDLGLWLVGDVVVLEKGVGPNADKVTVIDNLGKRGAASTEIARVAYQIGNGDVPPKAVRDIEREIADRGQKIIDEEIQTIESSGNRVVWGDGLFDAAFEHGKNRADFRELSDRYGKKVSVMTVDPETARDHDDALHAREVEIDGKEYVEVGVHIADVSHFVPIKKDHPWYPLFERAKELGFTLYSPRKAFPMLPHILSEQLCSLTEGDDRLSFSTVFLMEKDSGNIVKTWQGKSLMRCDNKIPYGKAQELLDTADVAEGDERKSGHTGLKFLQKYGNIRREERFARKEIAFPERGELDALIDTDSGEATAGVKASVEMNKVVQDWMIQANEAKAITITNKMLEAPDTFFTFLRFHEPPSLESIKIIAQTHKAEDILRRIEEYEQAGGEPEQQVGSTEPSFINTIVYDLLKFGEQLDVEKWREEAMRASVAEAVAKDGQHPLRGATPEETETNIRARLEYLRTDDRQRLQSQVLRLFTKAKYTTDPRAHFSLSKFPYTNGTSPIRRFADIIVHHLLEASLENDPARLGGITRDELEKIADHLNLREKIIDEASERTKAIWGAELFRQLQTTENPQPELSNVMVMAMFTKTEGKKNTPMLKIQMRHPSGPFMFTFEIPRRNVRGFPSKPEDAYQLELVRKPLTMKLTGVDIDTGQLWLQLEGRAETPSLREHMRPELLERMKQIAINDIEDLETEFPELIGRTAVVRDELNTLKTLVGTVTTATPANVVDGIGARIGSLRMMLIRYSGLSLEELLVRRGRTTISAEPPRIETPAHIELPAERRDSSGIQAQIRAEEARVAALERRVEILKEEKRVRDLERQIAVLKSRKT